MGPFWRQAVLVLTKKEEKWRDLSIVFRNAQLDGPGADGPASLLLSSAGYEELCFRNCIQTKIN